MDTWSEAPRVSWCTTRICNGSVADVAALLESYAASDGRFTVPGATLALRGTAPPANGVATVAPRRVHDARLRYARWLPAVRVSVEVDRWSVDACEVLVRPAARPPFAPDAYFAATVALLASMVDEVERALAADPAPASAGTPLRRAS